MMRYLFRNRLGRVCAALAEWLEEAARLLMVCEECGRSRYYGRPCKNRSDNLA